MKTTVLSVALVMLVLWASRGAWLPVLYTYLDVGETPARADVVVSLGSDMNRVVTAFRLYHEGLASEIIISGRPSALEEQLAFLESQGVPRESVKTVTLAGSTWGEAKRVMSMLRDDGAGSAMIVTDNYHTRRARATYEKNQASPVVRLRFIASDYRAPAENWWQDDVVRWSVFREYVKIAYYFFRYGVFSL